MNFELHHGDCLEVLRGMADNSVDSIVTDPPYGLTANKKGGTGVASVTLENPYGRARISVGNGAGGFMGMKWDSDVPPVEVWAECLRVLKPGGHLLAFAGTRTQHRMAVRIEDAGFEIRDMIAWVYGSGFPKSLDVSKAIDKAAGAEREVVGEGPFASRRPRVDKGAQGATFNDDSYVRPAGHAITAPATARQWQGWGTALKPALEPITVARKPLVGTVAENVLAHGTGALNVDGCRVPTEDKLGGGNNSATVDRSQKHEGWQRPWMQDAEAAAIAAERSRASTARSEALGRWPANLIHDGSDEVVAAFPAQAGASAPVRGTESSRASVGRVTGERDRVPGAYHADAGSAARFFYCAKASRADRNAGLPSGDTPAVGTAATMRDREDADWKARNGNHHPTVKPTDLMAYLCRLVTPPGGVVLDPFMGSGSTGKAAMREGFRFVGIEREAEYMEIARARITAEAIALTEQSSKASAQPDLFAEAA